MDYIKAFLIGGLICAAVQILLDRTKLMPGRVMVFLVCTGAVLGFIGAAIATVISSYICVAIQYFELNKQMKMAALIPCAIKYFLLSAIMYGVIALITTQLKPNPISTIVQVIVGGLVYVLLSAITRDEVFLEMLDKGLKMLRIRRK